MKTEEYAMNIFNTETIALSKSNKKRNIEIDFSIPQIVKNYVNYKYAL